MQEPGSPESEPVAESPAPALTMGFWEAQLRTTLGLAAEAGAEYTSKDRLRRIALMALAQLVAMFEAARADEEAVAEEAAKLATGILVPDSKIITLS